MDGPALIFCVSGFSTPPNRCHLTLCGKTTIQTALTAELEAALGRPRYGRSPAGEPSVGTRGYRIGRRSRTLTGTFGATEISVPRARLHTQDGGASEWRSAALRVDSLEEAGKALFAFTHLPPSQWKSARTTNAIERLHEEFKRQIKTQTVLPSDATAAMPFWALLASGQITMRKGVGWKTLTQASAAKETIDLAA
jgi:transposase-like protein